MSRKIKTPWINLILLLFPREARIIRNRIQVEKALNEAIKSKEKTVAAVSKEIDNKRHF